MEPEQPPERRKVGRPKAADPLAYDIAGRVRRDEYDQACAVARKRGLTLSGFVREAIRLMLKGGGTL